MTYVMGICVMLFEVDFQRVVSEVQRRVRKQIRGWAGSNIIEYMVNDGRDGECGSKSKALGRHARWHRMYTNNLVEEHDKLHPPLTNAIKDSAPKKIPHSIFEGG